MLRIHVPFGKYTADCRIQSRAPVATSGRPRKRKELVMLLKEMEHHESRTPSEQQIDLSLLWRELELEGAR
jgi:hypothetical protein